MALPHFKALIFKKKKKCFNTKRFPLLTVFHTLWIYSPAQCLRGTRGGKKADSTLVFHHTVGRIDETTHCKSDLEHPEQRHTLEYFKLIPGL